MEALWLTPRGELRRQEGGEWGEQSTETQGSSVRGWVGAGGRGYAGGGVEG